MNRNCAPYERHLLTFSAGRERLDREQNEWCGETKRTGTGEVRYFHSADALLAALLTILDAFSLAPEDNMNT